MSYYISLNGTTNYITVPQSGNAKYLRLKVVTYSSDQSGYLFDFRNSNSIYCATTANAGYNNFQVNGVNYTASNSNITSNIPAGTLSDVLVTLTSVSISGNVTVGQRYSISNYAPDSLQCDIYGITFYDSSMNIIQDFDFSTGSGTTLYGTSGNGTVNGTWTFYNSGGTGTNASITSIVASATASVLAPTISTSSNVSANIASVVAASTANAVNPTITTQKQATISSVIANATASGLVPQVGLFTPVSIQSVIANATASTLNPSVSTTRNITVISPVSSVIASALSPSIVVPMSTQITAVLASVIADALAPVILLNQSIWKSGNKPNTVWNIPNTPVLKDIWR